MKQMEKMIEQTADGSATLFVPALDEHYHSVKGARTESQHIFVDMGMKHHPATTLRILEVGFGTGLNAFLTLEAAHESGKEIHYTGIERYPLGWDTVEALAYSDDPVFRRIHESPWEEEVMLSPHFTLLKRCLDFTRAEISGETSRYDLIYFDAFAPEKQPEMWEVKLFHLLYVILKEGGALTTYCAKGAVRRMLQEAGFMVERLPGPPGGKREILRASKVKK